MAELIQCPHCGEETILLELGIWVCYLCGEMTEISYKINRIDREDEE